MPIDKIVEKHLLTPEKKAGSFEVSENLKSGSQETGQQIVAPVEEQGVAEAAVPTSDDTGVGSPGINTTKSSLHQNIESILEQDLEGIYFEMDKATQERFKIVGEQTTKEIIKLLESAKVSFKKVFKLITNWLKIIPGINKFFLEQEAKIKTDKILKI
ncbi:MAG: hypothetical protein ABIA91_01545 [Patescibacteria group bacterium]